MVQYSAIKTGKERYDIRIPSYVMRSYSSAEPEEYMTHPVSGDATRTGASLLNRYFYCLFFSSQAKEIAEVFSLGVF